MRKFTFLIILCSPIYCFSQMINDSTYKASTGKIYSTGQEVKLGLGSADDGSFKYIEPINSKGAKASADFAAQTVKLWRVKKVKAKDIDVVCGLFTINKKVYNIKIDAALLAKELQ